MDEASQRGGWDLSCSLITLCARTVFSLRVLVAFTTLPQAHKLRLVLAYPEQAQDLVLGHAPNIVG